MQQKMIMIVLRMDLSPAISVYRHYTNSLRAYPFSGFRQAQITIFKAPLAQMQMLLPCQLLNLEQGFRFQLCGDDDPGDAMAGNDLRQVV